MSVSSKNVEKESTNPVGTIGDLINTAIGVAIASEYASILSKEPSSESAQSAIKSSPEFSAAARVFDPIGVTMSTMGAIVDSVANGDGGSPNDYLDAFANVAGGILGSALATGGRHIERARIYVKGGSTLEDRKVAAEA